MTNDELIDRIHALEAFAIDYLKNRRERTFGQFWADFESFDPELHARLRDGLAQFDDGVRSALKPQADTTDTLSEGMPNPDRRIADGIPPDAEQLSA